MSGSVPGGSVVRSFHRERVWTRVGQLSGYPSMEDCKALRREIILFKDPEAPQPRDPTETVRVRNKASYDAALEEIGDVMRKLWKPDNDVKETAQQGRQLCECASNYILAVRTAQPCRDDGKAHLGRELKELEQRADSGVDPPPYFQGPDPSNVNAVSTWRSMLRAMETLRDLGNQGSHRGSALPSSDRPRIYEAANEVAHAVVEMARIYLQEQACCWAAIDWDSPERVAAQEEAKEERASKIAELEDVIRGIKVMTFTPSRPFEVIGPVFGVGS